MSQPVSLGLGRALAAVWRNLRSMRTALILLLVLALAAVVGSLVPQFVNSPQAVLEMFREHPLRARVFRSLQLFEVYGSWWFTLTYLLLMVSLVSCLLPRSRATLRGLRRAPQGARELDTMRHHQVGAVSGEPGEALARARRVLRRRRFRVAEVAPGLAGEKGLARELGSLLFHWSFVLILVGVVIGKGNGFTGRTTIVEGETWTEAHAGYDLPPREGRFFDESDHRGFQVRLADFQADYLASGLPSDFTSRVTVLEDGSPVRDAEVRVNHPLKHAGVKLFQLGYGWAPEIEIRKDGEPLTSAAVVFVTDEPDDLREPWRGVVKLPSLRPQVGIEFRLFPDVTAATLGQAMLRANSPFMTYQAYRGDLKLTSAQSVFDLDKAGLEKWVDGGVGQGSVAELPGGIEIRFPELREYSQFLVARDPGKGLTLGAALLMLLTLLPALYSSRRRVWVRARVDGEGTVLEVAGFAMQRRDAFEEEFTRLAAEVLERPAGERS